MNEWTFYGRLFYLKELEGEFSVSLKLEGTSKRTGSFSEQIAKISCLGDKAFYDLFKKAGIKVNDEVTISGHLETWKQKDPTKSALRLMLIADRIV